jgi:hypothetical protein
MFNHNIFQNKRQRKLETHTIQNKMKFRLPTLADMYIACLVFLAIGTSAWFILININKKLYKLD